MSRLFVRSSVRPSVTKRLGFGALDGMRAPSPRLLYSVGDCSMIQLNDSESLVSVQQVFSDHRARPRPDTQICYSSLYAAKPIKWIWGWGLGLGRKVEKSIFAISFSFGPPSLTDSPVTSYAAPRLLSHPLTVQNHSRALHIHGSASCKVDVGWDLSKKNENFEKNEKNEKSLKLFERETKFTSKFFVNANILILR